MCDRVAIAYYAVCTDCGDGDPCWHCGGIGHYACDAFDADFSVTVRIRNGHALVSLDWLRS